MIKTLLDFKIIDFDDYSLSIFQIISLIGIFIVTSVILRIIKKTLYRKHRHNKLDIGNTYALFQIIKYFIWIASAVMMLQSIGVKVSILLAGSAALLVGIGLGLQQTFNDILSGIILLSERTIKVNDILEIDNDIIRIEQIGLRTSKGLNRDDISVIIPNSIITTNKVINWSHQIKRTRFKITVGVAYGSDVDLVEKVLFDSALQHSEVTNKDLIDVRFIEFNNSSLDFQVLFFTENIFGIERIKSDIRKTINRNFIINKIEIPFPQMDLHMKSNK